MLASVWQSLPSQHVQAVLIDGSYAVPIQTGKSAGRHRGSHEAALSHQPFDPQPFASLHPQTNVDVTLSRYGSYVALGHALQ